VGNALVYTELTATLDLGVQLLLSSSRSGGDMSLQSLLLTQDPGVLSTLPGILKDAGISVEVHTSGEHFPAAIKDQRADTILVDFENGDAAELVRSAKSNNGRPVLAVVLASNNNAARQALQAGATLVLPKPLSRDKVLSGVRITRSLVVQEKRKTLRIPLQAAITFTPIGKKPVRGIAVNVNQGGVGFHMEQPPKLGQIGELRFALPGKSGCVVATVETQWVNPEKKAGGFRFTKVFTKDELMSWIAARCDGALADSASEPVVTYRN
jgi:CheY-like chemotaxis protein